MLEPRSCTSANIDMTRKAAFLFEGTLVETREVESMSVLVEVDWIVESSWKGCLASHPKGGFFSSDWFCGSVKVWNGHMTQERVERFHSGPPCASFAASAALLGCFFFSSNQPPAQSGATGLKSTGILEILTCFSGEVKPVTAEETSGCFQPSQLRRLEDNH